MGWSENSFNSILQAANNVVSGNEAASDFNIMGYDNAAAVFQTLLNNAQSAQNTEATNAANLQIHREDNDFNKREASKARQFELDMWNRTNAYNTPSAQLQRYMDAGLNPIAMMSGQSSAGNAANVGSAPSAASGSPIAMQSPQLYQNDFHSNFGDVLGAAQAVINGGKGFADTMVSLGRLKNETGLAETQNALNLAKALEARTTARATEVNTNSVVPATLRNMLAEYEEVLAKKNRTSAEEQLLKEQSKAVGAQIWKWVSDYDLGLKNVRVAERRNEIEASGNPWKIGMDFLNKTGLTDKIEKFIKGQTNGSVEDIFGRFKQMPLNMLLNIWDGFKGVVSEENLGYGHLLFAPVIKLGEFLMENIDKKSRASQRNFMPQGSATVLNPTGFDSY